MNDQSLPYLTAYTVDNAFRILKQKELEVHFQKTLPPHEKANPQEWRVLRQKKLSPLCIELLISPSPW